MFADTETDPFEDIKRNAREYYEITEKEYESGAGYIPD